MFGSGFDAKMKTIMRQSLTRLFAFLLGGGLGSLLCLIIVFVLTEQAGLKYMPSYGFGVSAAILFNFLFHRSITFRVRDGTKRRMAKFAATSLLIGAGIMALVYTFTEFMGLWYIFSGIAAIAIMSLVNFWINKEWVFSVDEFK